jgi:hypothetical protein
MSHRWYGQDLGISVRLFAGGKRDDHALQMLLGHHDFMLSRSEAEILRQQLDAACRSLPPPPLVVK